MRADGANPLVVQPLERVLDIMGFKAGHVGFFIDCECPFWPDALPRPGWQCRQKHWTGVRFLCWLPVCLLEARQTEGPGPSVRSWASLQAVLDSWKV